MLCAGGARDGSVEASVPGPLCLRRFYSLAGNRTANSDEAPQVRIDVFLVRPWGRRVPAAPTDARLIVLNVSRRSC